LRPVGRSNSGRRRVLTRSKEFIGGEKLSEGKGKAV